jgi:DNA excision repair protein ERCC-3
VPGPAIVQSDRSILLEVAHPDFEAARRALAAFAELEKSPEHIHTYRISAVSLWNAAAAGVGADEIARTLVRLSRYEVPQAVLADVRDLCARYGRLRLVQGEAGLLRLEPTSRRCWPRWRAQRRWPSCCADGRVRSRPPSRRLRGGRSSRC